MSRNTRTTSTPKNPKPNKPHELVMVAPAPIPQYVAPYTKRTVLRHNASLFVDGGRGRGHGGARVVPQIGDCAGMPDGTPCGPLYNGRRLMRCVDGVCVFPQPW